MNEHRVKSSHRFFATQKLRSGLAREQLLLIIVCSVASTVAVVSLLYFLVFDDAFRKQVDLPWQCLECGNAFASKTNDFPPIPCPKCGGQAVQVAHRTCPACGKKVVAFRLRLTTEGQARREAALEQAEANGQSGAGLKYNVMTMGPPPLDHQYWVEQPDDSFDWTPWINANSLQAQQIRSNLRCYECGADLTRRKNE